MALTAFLLLARHFPPAARADAAVESALQTLRRDTGWRWTIGLTSAEPVLAAIIVAVAAVVARRRGMPPDEFASQIALLVAALLVLQGFKLVLGGQRPGGFAQHPRAGGCFPSGHVGNAALCVASAVAMVGRRRVGADRTRTALIAFGLSFVLAVAFTRLYLRMHWFTDVAGSLLFAVAFGSFLTVWARGRWLGQVDAEDGGATAAHA